MNHKQDYEVIKMKLRYIFLPIIFVILIIPTVALAIPADVTGVRQMLTAVDNQDFSIFDEEYLIDSLVEIIETDPADAPFHERVIRGALAVLGELHAPEAVDLLIENLDDHTTTCLYWLGTYAATESIEAISEYLDDEDESVRYEAASAMGTIPLDDPAIGVSVNEEEFASVVQDAIALIDAQLVVEDDVDVIVALTEAREHLSQLEQD